MIKLFRLLAILCLFFNVSAYAVDCYQNNHGGNTRIIGELAAFRIPENAQPNQKIWESSDINVTVYVTMRQAGLRVIRQKMFMPGLRCPQ
ncbi:TPA: hypothetical protein OKV73_000215 [Escherichia albertii]|nr:hypothetical protein [Escherichia albertii]